VKERPVSDALATWARSKDRAVIFDFNGTLSNDEALLLPLFQDMFKEHLSWEVSEIEYFERLAGRSDREIIESAVAEHGDGDEVLVERLLEIRRDRYLDLVQERSPIEDGAVALVELLVAHGVPLGIVTGAQRLDVEFVLDHRQLRGVFGAIVTEEDVTHGKPHPEGFLAGAALLGVDPTSVLVFEDSVFGVRAARAAGMTVVGVIGTSPASVLAEEADEVVDALAPSIVEGALGGRPGIIDG
jgi:beta-phosphoglucomutase